MNFGMVGTISNGSLIMVGNVILKFLATNITTVAAVDVQGYTLG